MYLILHLVGCDPGNLPTPSPADKPTILRWIVRTKTARVAVPYPLVRQRHFCARLASASSCWAVWLLLAASRVVSGTVAIGSSPPDVPNTLAAGTKLYVRLQVAISTKTSHLNQPVTTRVVREVINDQGVLIPLRTEIAGTLAKLIPSSDPNDHARLLVRFTQLTIPNHAPLGLTARLMEVENARETVLQDGTIQGILEKDAAVGRMDGLLDKLGTAGSEMERVSGKALGKADTSIDYPPGTDLTLVLDQPLHLDSISPSVLGQVSPTLLEAVRKMLADTPNRAENKAKKPGDPLNLILVGDTDQILAAFQQAGWSAAKKLGARSAVGTVRAMASNEGYGEAPVSQLYLFDRPEDLAFEKMLNTFLKRHHLRLWESNATTADGREIWLGASTHDIGLDVHPGVVSHAIDPDLDAERAKVGADLMAGGLVAAEELVTGPNPLSEGRTATGGTWHTDGRMLLIELKKSK